MQSPKGDAPGLSAGEGDATEPGDALLEGTGDALAGGTSARRGGASLTTLVALQLLRWQRHLRRAVQLLYLLS